MTSVDTPKLSRSSIAARALLTLILVAFSAFVASPSGAANLGSNVQPNTSGFAADSINVYFAYVKAGEYLVTTGNGGSGGVTRPDGTTYSGGIGSPGFSAPQQATAATEGVWRIDYGGVPSWSITVYDGDPSIAGTQEMPGRVWTSNYQIAQTNGASNAKDLTFWMLNDSGYQYRMLLAGYNGANSSIRADSLGVPAGNTGADACTPSNRSWQRPHPGSTCGVEYRLFFEEPAADLPVTAPAWSLDTSTQVSQAIKPPPVSPTTLTASDFTFTRTGSGWAEGTFSYDMGNFFGSHLLQIDVDNNGDFDDPVDREIRLPAVGEPVSYDFDGLDGQGDAIAPCTDLNARVFVDRVGEIHVLQNDVEGRGSIEIVRENGPGAPDSTIYWDDTQLTDSRSTTTPVLDGAAGVTSAGGVHGWGYGSNGWGNGRMVDDFTYLPVDHTAGTLDLGGDCEPGLSLTKNATLDDANGNGFADVGEEITYSFDAENTGNIDMEDVSISDDKVTGLSPASADIPWNGTQTYTADPYVVTQEDVDAGSVHNEATASGTYQGTSGPATHTSDPSEAFTPTPARVPGLSIVKTGDLDDTNGDGVAEVGETINYEFEVENTGNVTMTGVTVNDPKVGAVSPAAVTLAPGATQTFTAPYVVDTDDTATGSVYNAATATGTSPLGPFTSQVDDVEIDALDPDPQLQLTKDAALTTDVDGDGEAELGDVITYTFTVENTGNVDIDDVSIVDPKVGSVTPASADIAKGDSQDFTATYAVTQPDVDADTVFNSATAKGTYPNGTNGPVDVESPPDTVTFEVDRDPGLSIDKSSDLDDANGNGYADVGEKITYTFAVKNTGNTTLEDVTVVDPRVGSTSPASADLAVGKSVDFAAEYVVTQGDVDDGSVLNEASVRGNVPGGPETISPPDHDEVPVPPADPRLAIDKDAHLVDDNHNGIADKGESVIYTFEVANSGNVTIVDVAVDDKMLVDAGLTLDPASYDVLAPGETVHFEAAPYVVTDANVDDGQLKNVATAAGTAPDGGAVTSAEDDVSIDTHLSSDGDSGTGAGEDGGDTGTGAGDDDSGLPDTGGPALLAGVLAAGLLVAGVVILGAAKVRKPGSRV